jgi:hypothetical protein
MFFAAFLMRFVASAAAHIRGGDIVSPLFVVLISLAPIKRALHSGNHKRRMPALSSPGPVLNGFCN